MSDFKAKMHQLRFRLGLCPDPAGRAYIAPPDPLAGFKGPTSKGREGNGREGGEREGEGGRKKGREGKGKDPPPLLFGQIEPCGQVNFCVFELVALSAERRNST